MMASTIGASTTVTIVFASVVVMFVTIVITVSFTLHSVGGVSTRVGVTVTLVTVAMRMIVAQTGGIVMVLRPVKMLIVVVVGLVAHMSFAFFPIICVSTRVGVVVTLVTVAVWMIVAQTGGIVMVLRPVEVLIAVIMSFATLVRQWCSEAVRQ